MKVYKVVDRETRYGSNFAMWIKNWSAKDYYNSSGIPGELQKYIPKYEIGNKVECAPGSPGIMCFYTRTDAENYIRRCGLLSTMIVEVEGKDLMECDEFWGKVGCGSDIFRLINARVSIGPIYIKGLVTFKEVTVLN